MNDIPSITVTEPVYESPDDEESVWKTCELEWSEEHEAFVNREAEPEWVLDDEAFPDSTYEVNGKEFTSLEDAMREAVGDEQFEEKQPRVTFEYWL